MNGIYNGKHEICFWKKEFNGNEYAVGEPKFTWTDFNLIPFSRPSISIPKVNYIVIQIPNSNKRLNITEYIPGGGKFENRTGEWQFYIGDNDSEWPEKYSDLIEYFNGSRMLVSLDNTKDIYEGRIYLSGYEPGDDYSSITLTYDLDSEPIAEFDDILFRIRFMNSSGLVLQEERLSYNDTPYFKGEAPAEGNRRFKNWRPAVKQVKKNVDYYPVYR